MLDLKSECVASICPLYAVGRMVGECHSASWALRSDECLQQVEGEASQIDSFTGEQIDALGDVQGAESHDDRAQVAPKLHRPPIGSSKGGTFAKAMRQPPDEPLLPNGTGTVGNAGV